MLPNSILKKKGVTMKFTITQHELRESPHWRAMDKKDATIIPGILPQTRDEIASINQGDYIPVYEYSLFNPIKVLQFTNAITYYEENEVIKAKLDPFVEKVIEEIKDENFIMISRNERNVLIVGTLDMNTYEDSIIKCPYLIKEGYLYITNYKINEYLAFTPLNHAIRVIKQLQENDTKPLDLNNPEDLNKARAIYEKAREQVYRNSLAVDA